MVVSGTKVGAGSDTLTPEAVTKRIAPVAGFELVDANAPKVFKTGEQVFAAVCTACHTAGVAGAPKIGDNAAWAPFIKAGYESLLNVALHGKGGMPAKGGNPTLSDYEVARAVVYMANKSGASLPEPAAPAEEGAKKEEAAAPAAAAPAAAAPAPAAAAPAVAAPAAAAPAPAAAAPRRNRPPSTRPAKSSTRASASPVTPPAWPTRQVRRQGRLGALHQDRHGRDGEGRHAGQAAHAAQGRRGHRHGRRHPRGRAIHGGRGQVVRRSAPPEGGTAKDPWNSKGLLHWRTPGLPATRTRILATAPSVRASARVAPARRKCGPRAIHQAAAGSSSDMPSCTRRCSHRLGR